MKTFEGQAIITFKLTEEDVDDIMAAALEGGINYWCCKAGVVGKYLGEYASDQISRGGKLKLYDAESDDVWELDIEKFMQGFRLWIENGQNDCSVVRGDGSIDTYEIDAVIADEIIQYSLFGEIVFG